MSLRAVAASLTRRGGSPVHKMFLMAVAGVALATTLATGCAGGLVGRDGSGALITYRETTQAEDDRALMRVLRKLPTATVRAGMRTSSHGHRGIETYQYPTYYPAHSGEIYVTNPYP